MANYYDKKKVFSFEKSKHEEVQFAVRNWKGRAYGDIQIYHIAEDGSRESTNKGFFISAGKLSEFKQGVERLMEATEKEKAE